MEIISYTNDYFDMLIEFLRKNWASEHSMYDKELFDWQYGGMNCDPSSSLIAMDDDNKIVGFLGIISYSFLVNGTLEKAAGLAIWIVDKDIKHTGIGLYLKKAIEDKFNAVYTIGINLSTVNYYKKLNYNYYESLNRFVVPLDFEGYTKLLIDYDAGDCSQIREWVESVNLTKIATNMENPNAVLLEKIYKNSVASSFLLAPNKDAAFWSWRYINSKGFKYSFCQDEGGLIVYRMENVHAPTNASVHGLKCLRIIEIIPANNKAWNGQNDTRLVQTILSVLALAKKSGCVLADFQISNSKLAHILEAAGFKLQDDNKITNVVRLFAPYRTNASSLNFTYRAFDGNNFLNIDREDTYFLKSDTDMDRPNFLA